MIPEFYYADTRVFWDVKDFPVPADGDLRSFVGNITSALKKEGYRGHVSVWAYTEMKPTIAAKFFAAGIFLVYQSNSKIKRLNRMVLDMMDWVRENPLTDDNPLECNLLVVAKDLEKGYSQFVRTLTKLDGMNYNIHMVAPVGNCTFEGLYSNAILLWRWESLFGGGLSMDIDTSYDEGSSGDAKRQKTDATTSEK